MNISRAAIRLAWLIAALALVAAAAGLFWQPGSQPTPVTSLRGQTVYLYGQGLYRYDSMLVATAFKVGDAVTLLLAIPALLWGAWRYGRGSLKGGLVLTGALAYLLYNYTSMTFGAAYNPLFLVYIALFSLSLFAFILAFTSIDPAALRAHLAPNAPRRAVGVFQIVAGVILMAVWTVLSIIPALLQGVAPPEVETYTTVITFVIDLGMIAPTLILAGVWLLRRAPLADLLGATLLVFYVILGISLLIAGIVQQMAGLMTIGQFIGFTASFGVLTIINIGLTALFFRRLSDAALVGKQSWSPRLS